jgi:pimeloyl-ACP methyl ester carboxylesterase
MRSARTPFVFIPGAGGMAWYWYRVVEILAADQREVITMDLPADDDQAGLHDYADAVVRAIGGRQESILVAQSLGGFTAPLVCQRTPVRALVFINAMIPLPGERVGAWWENTRAAEARVEAATRGRYGTEFDPQTYFLHDVPYEVLSAAPAPRQQSDRVFEDSCDFDRWPPIPIQVIASKDDRFFPVAFQERVARERLGKDPVILAGGHLVALSNPQGVADTLLRL